LWNGFVEFLQPQEGKSDIYRYVVYDGTSGEKRFEYEPGDLPAGPFLCYDWNGGFTFLTTKDRQRALLHARAH
jgi:hypothetical protein